MDVGIYVLLSLAVIGSGGAASDAGVTCTDEKGNAVDWYMVYKLPRLKHENPLVAAGVAYAYLDVNNPQWQLSTLPVNSSDTAIGRTLAHIYETGKQKDEAYILYNDETPEKNTSFTRGHTKGVISFDKDAGFWLVHSLPRFPEYARLKYEYPPSGLYYGQTFLCMSLDISFFDKIGEQLLYTYPQVYDYNVPETFDVPSVMLALKGEHVKSEPWTRKLDLTTLAKQSFTSYAKYTKFGADLYDAWVAPDLDSELRVETWQNGVNPLPSNCTANNKVYNIKKLNVCGVEFPETEDHSKWAVTHDRTDAQTDKAIICIGDINRMESQFHRAGGTVCSHIVPACQSFQKVVSEVQPCGSADNSINPKLTLS